MQNMSENHAAPAVHMYGKNKTSRNLYSLSEPNGISQNEEGRG